MALWKFEANSNNQNFCNVAIKPGIFQGDSLLSLLFIVGLIPLRFLLRKYKKAYEFTNSTQRINNLLLYMDKLKLYGKTAKSLDLLIQTVRIFSSNICKEFGAGKRNILILKIIIKDENYDII